MKGSEGVEILNISFASPSWMKQKDILDSIYYARRIQKSLMANEKHIENKLKQLTSNGKAI